MDSNEGLEHVTGNFSLFSRATTFPSTRSVDYMHYTCRRNNLKTPKFLTLYATKYCTSEVKILTEKAENAIFADGNGSLSPGNESESSAARRQSEPYHRLYADITLRSTVQD